MQISDFLFGALGRENRENHRKNCVSKYLLIKKVLKDLKMMIEVQFQRRQLI